MPITDEYQRLPITAITVDREGRQRKELDSKDIQDSISRIGLLNPIIVEQESETEYRLVAGERRLLACQELGWENIPVRFAKDLSDIERQIYELEENIKRKDISWQDMVKATERIHNLYREMTPDWSQNETADAIGLTKGTVSIYLNIADYLDEDEQIQTRRTAREAYNVLNDRRKREDAAIVDSLLRQRSKSNGVAAIGGASSVAKSEETGQYTVEGSEQSISGPVFQAPQIPVHDYRALQNPARNIILEDFRFWAPKYNGPPFNLIHCDFPYGISVFDGPQSGGERQHIYDDRKEIHFELLAALLDNFDRIASVSCHVMFWFSMQHYDQIRQMVATKVPNLLIQTHPLIWLKSDNKGIASDPRHGPRHIYETALLMTRNKRHVVKVVSDAYAAPTDNAWHIHTKPEPMLRYFFEMLVDEHTRLLDPTCGSGSAVRAAESLKAHTVLGMDVDETLVGHARQALRSARNKRGASALVNAI